MRHFHKILFFGGESEYTKTRIKLLKKIFKLAINHASGIQQPCHSESEEAAIENQKAFEDGKQELDDIVRDIAMALTGKEIDFKESKK